MAFQKIIFLSFLCFLVTGCSDNSKNYLLLNCFGSISEDGRCASSPSVEDMSVKSNAVEVVFLNRTGGVFVKDRQCTIFDKNNWDCKRRYTSSKMIDGKIIVSCSMDYCRAKAISGWVVPSM